MNAPAQELDFGQARRLEAQLAMRAVLGRMEKEPFTAQRLMPGQLVHEFADIDEAAVNYFRGALESFLVGLGVEVRVILDGTASLDIKAMMASLAPYETVVIGGTVPGNALEQGRKATAQIAEACVEMVRVLLGTAIAAAAEDCAADERIVVVFRGPPEIGGRIDFTTGQMGGVCRIHAVVYCEREQRVSYLLGSVHGQPKRLAMGWQFPLVEQIYGPNRLRWRDLRSPDYELAPAAEVAS